jgi:hypothetical protein
MKVCGFTFIRNAVKFDYPVREAISSILPLCDKFVVAVGQSEDETRPLVETLDREKIILIDSIWDETIREGGRVLAAETNKAMDAIPEGFDWAFYIQADEVLHEKYHAGVRESMSRWKADQRVDGLLFRYKHFYGSYDYVGDSTRWYRNEVRVIRPLPSIRSFRDAQGFKKSGKLLRVRDSGATIYHYGWVKPPKLQQEKQKYFHSLWHSDAWLNRNVGPSGEFDYSEIDSLSLFKETHPLVMRERIMTRNWKFDYDPSRKKLSLKSKVKMLVEKCTGWRPGEYKNYRLLK